MVTIMEKSRSWVSALGFRFLVCLKSSATLHQANFIFFFFFSFFSTLFLPCLPNLQTDPPGAQLNPALISSQTTLQSRLSATGLPWRWTSNGVTEYVAPCLCNMTALENLKEKKPCTSLTQIVQVLPLYFGMTLESPVPRYFRRNVSKMWER